VGGLPRPGHALGARPLPAGPLSAALMSGRAGYRRRAWAT
jgi:hypothetical protein